MNSNHKTQVNFRSNCKEVFGLMSIIRLTTLQNFFRCIDLVVLFLCMDLLASGRRFIPRNNPNASVSRSSQSQRESDCDEPEGDLGRDEGSETARRLFLADR